VVRLVRHGIGPIISSAWYLSHAETWRAEDKEDRARRRRGEETRTLTAPGDSNQMV